MGLTVGADQLSLIHKKSGGVSFVFPDLCKTPTPVGPIPIPYPNVAQSLTAAKGTKKVKADGQSLCIKHSIFARSNGNEPGVGGGIISGRNMERAQFVSSSLTVSAEGKKVCRAFDLVLHNKMNTFPTPVIQPPLPVVVVAEKPECLICGEHF